MSLIFSLPVILEESKKEYETIKAAASSSEPFFPVEQVNDREGALPNMLVHGDNLAFIQYLMREKGLEGKLRLVYMDPPFYSKASYDAVIRLKSRKIPDDCAIKPTAYDDSWKTGIEDYLRMLCIRLFLARDLLDEDGCCWVHLDWHAVHYVKILMDEIFGQRNFVNEIIWNYKSGGTGKRNFSRKHDTLLFYGKTSGHYFHPLQEKSYNRGYKPYCFKGVQEYEDELGWYTLVNMKDVWQIDMVGRTSSERTGYATQKPEQLLCQIVESCTRPGDLCADFFGGSGTLAAAAQSLGRHWISCDMGGIAMACCLQRMAQKKSGFTVLQMRPDPWGDALELDVKIEQLRGADEKKVTITLRAYHGRMDRIGLKDQERETVEAFLRQDSLQLLAYWSVDFHYDGKTHRPEVSFPKAKEEIETVCERRGRDIHKISVRAVDVFGGTTLKVLDLSSWERSR
ncbi:MAG: site-specific DNA-methyltransferase [Firmicutes bacterium]|nr:site-specific DNA-methyltransferase [Bacillota bacterium]